MDRGGRKPGQGGDDGIGVPGTAYDAVVGMLTAMRPLQRERADLMRRHEAGLAEADDLHRYRMARLRLLMLEAANRGVRPPRRAEAVLAERARLTFDALVDRRDQYPEPQPS